MMGPFCTQPTYTSSPKQMARGDHGAMRSTCRLVRENTSICDDAGMFNALSTDGRYPRASSNSSVTSPEARRCCRRATGPVASVRLYAIALWSALDGSCPSAETDAAQTPATIDARTSFMRAWEDSIVPDVTPS